MASKFAIRMSNLKRKGRTMKANVVRFSVAALFAISASAASAMEVRPLLKAGYDTGGDTLVTVVFTNGDRQDIKSSQGLFFGGGMSIVNAAGTLESELALTYKIDLIHASNGDVTWSRWPIDALVFYRWPQVRLGGGLTYHVSPSLSGSGVASNINLDFKDSLGYIIQGDWRITPRMNLGLRYSSVDYKTNTGPKVNAAGVGLVYSISF
jgi:hypothetical protein